jgi:PEP-CTERM motif
MKTSFRTALYAATAGFALLGATQAYATPMKLILTSFDVNTSTTVTDVFGDSVSPICDGITCVVTAQSSANTISVAAGTLGAVQFSGELSTSTIGSFINLLQTSALTVLNPSTTDTYRITASLVGMNFIGPANRVSLAGSGTWQQTGANNVFDPINYQWFDDTTNSGIAGVGDMTGNYTNPTFSGVTQGFSFTVNNAPLANPDTGLYSMSEVWSYTLKPGQELENRGLTESKTFDAPEPASLLLLGAGTLGIGMIRRRRS